MNKLLAFGIDAVLTLVFVAIGMSSHDSPWSDYPTVAAPFILALVLGYLAWFVTLPGHSPAGIKPGLLIWAVTTAGGLLLRFALGDGVSGAFPIITAVVLFVFLFGWRVIYQFATRTRRS